MELKIGDTFKNDDYESVVIGFKVLEGYGEVVVCERSDGIVYRLPPDLVISRINNK
jgi:hypothetical protein